MLLCLSLVVSHVLLLLLVHRVDVLRLSAVGNGRVLLVGTSRGNVASLVGCTGINFRGINLGWILSDVGWNLS